MVNGNVLVCHCRLDVGNDITVFHVVVVVRVESLTRFLYLVYAGYAYGICVCLYGIGSGRRKFSCCCHGRVAREKMSKEMMTLVLQLGQRLRTKGYDCAGMLAGTLAGTLDLWLVRCLV